MKAFRPLVVAALFLSFPALAAVGVHSIWSSRGFFVKDSGVYYNTVTNANSVVSWNEVTGTAFANFHGFAAGNEYDFELIGSPASAPSAFEFTGLWNIRRNGALICGGCSGTAYGLNLPVGQYFKFYTVGETFGFSAFVDSRKDY